MGTKNKQKVGKSKGGAGTAKRGKPQPPKRAAGKPARGPSQKAKKDRGPKHSDPPPRKGGAKGSAGKGASTAIGDESPRRKLGIRGAAPWAARHAAKHAAEARARAALPPPPGSARATIRTPSGAEEIKAKIGNLHNALTEIRNLRRNVLQNFYEIGHVLRDIQNRRLYEARGFGTFEGFLDREVDIGKITALRLVRIVDVFKRDAALEFGMERVLAAMAVLEASADKLAAPATTTTKSPLPMRPPALTKK